jgi:hypothetical protein
VLGVSLCTRDCIDSSSEYLDILDLTVSVSDGGNICIFIDYFVRPLPGRFGVSSGGAVLLALRVPPLA